MSRTNFVPTSRVSAERSGLALEMTRASRSETDSSPLLRDTMGAQRTTLIPAA